MWMGRINVYNSKDLPENIDIDAVLEDVEERIPSFMLSNIESIYIGDFDSLKDREMNAVYADGAIYIASAELFDDEDLVDDIIHEIAHSLEETYAIDVYGDGQLEREFIMKRLQLFDALRNEDIPFLPRDYFLKTEYSSEFDKFLYKMVGYPLLTSLTMNIFASPYGITSLREYFANAFEKYFMGSAQEIKNISPQAYKKIKELLRQEEELEYGNI